MTCSCAYFDPSSDRSQELSNPYTDNERRDYPFMEERPSIRAVVADNLSRLMEARPDLSSNIKLSELTDLGTGTITRIRNGAVGCTIDTLDVLAKQFGLQAWQMLIPGIEPKALPELQPTSAEERELYEKIRALVNKQG
jgi:hypothetical protein